MVRSKKKVLQSNPNVPPPTTHTCLDPRNPPSPKSYISETIGESMEVAEGQQETWLSAWLTVRL